MKKQKNNLNTKIDSLRKSDSLALDMASSIINNTSDAIIGTNLKGEITLWNNGAVNLYGYTTKEALGKNISIIYREEDLPVLGQTLQKVMQGENISNVEVIVIDKFKNEHSILLSINGLKNKKGKIDQLVGFSKDITEQILAQKNLKESEHSFSKAFDNSPIPISILNLKTGKRLAINNTFCKTFGYSKEELVNEENFKKNNIAVDQKVFISIVKKILSKGIVFEHPFSMYTKSGEIRETLVNATRVYPGNNDVHILSFLDVTDRKIVENALLSSEKKFRNLAETAQVAIAILEEPPGTRFLYVNPFWENLTGYSSKEAEKLSAKDLVSPDFHKLLSKEAIKSVSKGKVIDRTEFKIITKSGETKWIKFTATTIDFEGQNAVLRTGLDITDQKNVEQELLLLKEQAEQSEKYLDRIINNIGDPVFVNDEQNNFLLVNDAFCNFLGIDREDVIGKTLAEDISAEEMEGFLRVDKEVLETGQESIIEEWVTLKGGETKTIYTKKTRYIDANGKKHLIGVIRDITDRKKAEEVRLETLSRLNLAVNTAKLGVWSRDAETDELFWNDRLFEIYGISPDELEINLDSYFERLHPDDLDYINEVLGLLYEGEPLHDVKFRIIRPDNEIRYIDSSAAPLVVNGRIEKYIGINRDITEQKIAEEKIKESEEKYQSFFRDNISALFMMDMKKPISVKLPVENQVASIIKYGVISDANKAIANSFGVKNPADLIGLPLTSIYSPESLLPNGNVFIGYKQFIMNGYNLMNSESEETTNSGVQRWYLNNAKGIVKDNHLVRILGSAIDITERKITEEHLKESEEKYRTLFEQSMIGIGMARGNEVIFGNKAMMALWKYDNLEDYKKIPLIDHIAPDSRELVKNRIKKGLANKGKNLPAEYQYNIVCKDGEIRTVRGHTSYMEIGGETYAQTVVMDITQSVKQEKELISAKNTLEESKTRFEILSNVSFEGILIHDNGVPVDMNNSFPKMFGYTKEEFKNEDLVKLIIKKEHHNIIIENIKNDYQQPYELIGIKKDGTEFPIEIEGKRYISEENKKLRVASIRDITERKKAEEKIKQSNLELIAAVSSLNELKKQLEGENVYLKKELDLVFNFEEMVYGSDVFSKVLTDVERVAPTDATVLILGESGTGKELLARALHNLSLRNHKPFIKVNCSAIPSELIESEFFGHKKGSFTGAISDKVGKFELAEGGTLFLDEIGDLPIAMQPKILRFLQEGEIEVVGGAVTQSLDVRIIAATNKDLKAEVKNMQFREDLYFRLNVFPIEAPALRDRKEDIPLLVEHFVDRFGKKYRKSIKYIADSAMQDMRAYNWPGNIRELENLVERSVILSDSETLILPGFGSQKNKRNRAISRTNLTLNDVQKNHILSVLEMTNWKIDGPNGAAQILDIKPSTFRDKLKKLGIKRPA